VCQTRLRIGVKLLCFERLRRLLRKRREKYFFCFGDKVAWPFGVKLLCFGDKVAWPFGVKLLCFERLSGVALQLA